MVLIGLTVLVGLAVLVGPLAHTIQNTEGGADLSHSRKLFLPLPKQSDG
jgi:hypothetical protein